MSGVLHSSVLLVGMAILGFVWAVIAAGLRSVAREEKETEKITLWHHVQIVFWPIFLTFSILRKQRIKRNFKGLKDALGEGRDLMARLAADREAEGNHKAAGELRDLSRKLHVARARASEAERKYD